MWISGDAGGGLLFLTLPASGPVIARRISWPARTAPMRPVLAYAGQRRGCPGAPGTATRLRVIEIQLDALLDLRLAIHMRTGRYDRRYGHGTGAAHRPSPFLPGRAEPP
jgi:hypothetical protein